MRHIILKKLSKNLFELFDNSHESIPIVCLLAVSGGADSIAMLHALNRLKEQFNIKISVITVNHNIRSESETKGDAEFVFNFCKKMNPPVDCIISELPKGAVNATALKRKNGVEDAARFLRYIEFEKAALKVNADYIFTAHTQNDYYETVLMRLFKGADVQSVFGISKKRGKFIRPMLNISRSEIEDYLNSYRVEWREDFTNFEQTYLRNKIRLNLIPVLNTVFDGWQSGLDKTLNYIKEENYFVETIYQNTKKAMPFSGWRVKKNHVLEKSVYCDFDSFINLPYNFKIKFIREGVNLINGGGRLSYFVFKDLSNISYMQPKIFSGGFLFEKIKNTIYLTKKNQHKTDCNISYMVWIENEGKFITPAGEFAVFRTENDLFCKLIFNNTLEIGRFKIPFCIRSKLLGDSIFVNGNHKTVKKVINELKLNYEERELLPIIEEGGVVRCVCGSVFGKKNYTI